MAQGSRYSDVGLPDALRAEVYSRDAGIAISLADINRRCRWCGATNRGGDLHHIEYRRGFSYDVADNLITLCRLHHGFIHGTPAANGDTITKAVAQLVLQELVKRPGTTGMSVWRGMKRRWVLDGRCTKHGEKRDTCPDCAYETRRFH